MSKTRIEVPVGIVDVSLREGWDRSFAYWILAKRLYKNSTVYNFSLRKLSKLLRISHECLRHHYCVWEKNGLVRLHSNNITFCGWKEMEAVASRNFTFEKKFRRKICLLLFDNVNDQQKCIQSRVVLKNINQQVRNNRIKRETIEVLKLSSQEGELTPEQFKTYKLAKKRAAKFGKSLKSYNAEVFISDKFIADKLMCSTSYSKTLKRFMVSNGIIRTLKVMGRKVSKMSLSSYSLNREYCDELKSTFWYKGVVYSNPKTMYTLGDVVTPVSLSRFRTK